MSGHDLAALKRLCFLEVATVAGGVALAINDLSCMTKSTPPPPPLIPRYAHYRGTYILISPFQNSTLMGSSV